MPVCYNCGMDVHDNPYQKDGEIFCSKRCYERYTQTQRLTDELRKAHEATIEVLVTALDAREKETGKHSHRVARYTLLMAERMGLPKDECKIIYHGALLHDIGKIGVSDNILLKPDKLTEDEWIEMRKHPVIGHNILKNIDYFAEASEIVLTHEERYDGTGYPRSLRGEEIPLGSRLFVISDTIDAITFDRPYRKAKPFEVAMEEINAHLGTQFDPLAVSTFNKCAQELEELIHIYYNEIKSYEKEETLYDPVCTMETNKSSRFYSLYNNKTFYFCSKNCQEIFDKNPEKYEKQTNFIRIHKHEVFNHKR